MRGASDYSVNKSAPAECATLVATEANRTYLEVSSNREKEDTSAKSMNVCGCRGRVKYRAKYPYLFYNT
jgi:hypothetical protein